MTCEQAELHMADLLAGSLQPRERGELEGHLLDCAPCRAAFELARAGMSAAWPAPTPSPGLVEKTRALFREPSWLLRALRLGTAAAALLCAALVLATSGAPAPRTSPAGAGAGTSRPRPLAFVQEAALGTLYGKDDQGRPVGELGLRSHLVQVEIQDGVAKTTVEEDFQNHTDRRLEGTFQFPLPQDASISRLALEVNGKLEEGTCLERERAREVFESIVRRMKDPALLEWMPGGLFQCRIFPIEPRSTKRVVVAYTQALPFFRGRLTYVYPLASEKTQAHPPGELRVDVRARFTGRLSSIESPSHRFDVQRRDLHEARMSFEAKNLRPEHDVVVTMETGDEELRVVPHREAGEEGYFALFVSPRGEPARKPGRFVFLLDVSASVTGPELEVAKRVVRGMIERRIEGDRFFILAHHIEVQSGGEVDLRTANDFMDRLQPLGGSDLLGALKAAPEGEIIYIGKGNATYGETETGKILEAVRGRRVRAVAVGSRANTAFFEKLGGLVQVSPNEDVSKRVAEIASTLGSPALSGIQVQGGEGVFDLVGVRDIFYGERLVVLGRYRGERSKLVVRAGGYEREMDVSFPAQEAGNNYVPRLWAQRKIAELLRDGESRKREVTNLGVRYQIMTPYTSFLVLENEQMWKDHQLKREVQKEDRVLGQPGVPAGKESRKGVPEGAKTDPHPGAGEGGEPSEAVRRLFEEATDLYRRGRSEEAASKFEEAFRQKPSSDQVYALMKRAGEDLFAEMMNSPERKMQDTGRRIYELAKPGEPFREGKAVIEKYLEDLRKEGDFEVWRNAFWHLRNIGPQAVGKLMPALGDPEHDRYRSRVMVLLTEMGADASLAVAEALRSPDPLTRKNASIVLGNIKDERTLPLLAQRLEDPQELPEVKKLAEEARRKIERRGWTPPAAGAVPAQRDSQSRSSIIEEALKQQQSRERGTLSIAPERRLGPERPAEPAPAPPMETPEAETATIVNRANPKSPSTAPTARPFPLLRDDAAQRGIPRGGEDGEGRYVLALRNADASSHSESLQSLLRTPGAPPAQPDPSSDRSGSDFPGLDALPLLGYLWTAPSANPVDGILESSDHEEYRGLPLDGLSVTGFGQGAGVKVGPARPKPSPSSFLPPPTQPAAIAGKTNHLVQMGSEPTVAPKKPIEGKVTAVADQIGLVVISVGKDDGVLEGDEFTIYRGGDFVAKIAIDRADRKWSAGMIVVRRSDPRTGDDAANHIFVSAPRDQAMGSGLASGAPTIKVAGLSGNEVTLRSGTESGVRPRQLFAITRDQRFVAIVLTQEASESRAWAVVWKGLLAGRILPGDAAAQVNDVRAYLESLPEESKLELGSELNLARIRAKLRIR